MGLCVTAKLPQPANVLRNFRYLKAEPRKQIL